MSTRRAISPAARGVQLAVSAALRGRVVSITDAPDGTTHAVVREADGRVLLDCRVRSVTGRRDDRQPSLPLAPGLRHETPAPVALVREAAPEVADLDDDDDGPAPVHGVCVGDRLTLDGEPIEVMGVDEEGFAWRTVATDSQGRSGDEGETLWSELADEGLGRWRSIPTPTPPAPPAPPSKPKRAPKARPAHLTPEPEADALTVRGQRCVITQLHEGGPWELIWSDEMPGQMTHDDAWKAVTEQASRARRYNRGSRCVADTRAIA